MSWQNRSLQTRIRNGVTRYFYSGWQPAALCFGLLVIAKLLPIGSLELAIGSTEVSSLLIDVGAIALWIGLAVTFIGLIAATSWNLMKKRWLQGVVSLCLLIFCCGSLNVILLQQFLFAADLAK